MKKLMIVGAVGLMAFAHAAAEISPEELARKQARSVHLAYDVPIRNAVAMKGSVTVTETQANSYYCLYGWDCGYCGIQDLGNRGRVLIFSVWDPGDPMDLSANHENVHEDLRAKVLYASPFTDVARFGGEGTGARTMTVYGWKVGEPVTVRVESAPDGADRTAYTCFVQLPGEGTWVKIATISTLKHPGRAQGLNGLYSFVEDFARNYASAKLSRRAEYGDLAVKGAGDADWRVLTRAIFTADGTPSNAVDAGKVANGNFFLQTGGATTNAHVKLWSRVD